MVSIKQFNGTYFPQEDRLVFRFNTADDAEYRLWFTRRITLFILTAANQLIQAQLEEQHTPDVAKAISEFERESLKKNIQEDTQTGQPSSYEPGSRYPLGADPLLVLDAKCTQHREVGNGNIQYANQGFLEATGYSLEEIIGKNYRVLDSGLHSQTFFAGLWATLQSGRVWHGTLRNKKKSGEFFWVDVTIVPFKDVWGKVSSYLTLYTNITESIAISEKYNQERLLREELARVNRDLFNDVNTDSLTGVSNRRALTSFIDKSISAAQQFGMPVSFLMLDLDHFKYINDNYGHSVGDLVLQEITQRWKKQIHSSDMLARIGGEEFCIVLPQAGLQQAKTIAEKIRLATSQAAIHVHNHQTHDLNLNISVSIGLVSSENRTQYDATMLMEFADKALYQAKVLGVIKSLRVPKRH